MLLRDSPCVVPGRLKINSNKIPNSKVFSSPRLHSLRSRPPLYLLRSLPIFFLFLAFFLGNLFSHYNNNLVERKLIFLMSYRILGGRWCSYLFSHFCLVSRSSIHRWLIVTKAWTGGGCDFRQERRNARRRVHHHHPSTRVAPSFGSFLARTEPKMLSRPK